MFPNNRKQESADCKLPPRFSFQSRLNSLSKVTRCFSLGGLCSFLCPPDAHERKERSADLSTALLCLFFLNRYLVSLVITEIIKQKFIIYKKTSMENRECPYCHKKVSLRKCIKYIIKGTKYSTTCNHCGQQLWLEKEPLPFMYCVSAGFFMMYLPMQFFLYYCNLDFIDSVLYCLPIAVVAEAICSIVVLDRKSVV